MKKAPAQHVYVWEEEWAVVSRDDVDGDSPILIHELPSAESSDNDKTFELRTSSQCGCMRSEIVNERKVVSDRLSSHRMSRLRLLDCVVVVNGCVISSEPISDFESKRIVSSRLVSSSIFFRIEATVQLVNLPIMGL